ncbi:MAG: SUMF1/EgtB/PvdO family nonheme iron enzyme [Bacteroidales bacterium]|nr:SUMF1/EgtB/PvdO family nonheme iron enzyme [Bacteroidales bacterium]MDY0140604.1 SUMF1/EgtB/PvdO family nonheme iron enzyme [Bacteroidales bacterium]
MKRIILLLFISSFCVTYSYSAKPIIPPGTAKINDSLYVDKTEVRNIDYIEFVYWCEREFGVDSDEYLSILPDTLVWESQYNEPMINLYFRHPAYNLYPVVGVSYEQAVKYCEWRTDRVNEMLYLKLNKLQSNVLKNEIQVPAYVIYRLPSIQEWEKVAGLPLSKRTMKKLQRKKYQNLHKCNLNVSNEIGVPDDMASITTSVNSYWPNELGVYNMIGNVAEMTSEKGIAKGGSWKHKPDEVSVENSFNYEIPKAWLGFRCICDVNLELLSHYF